MSKADTKLRIGLREVDQILDYVIKAEPIKSTGWHNPGDWRQPGEILISQLFRDCPDFKCLGIPLLNDLLNDLRESTISFEADDVLHNFQVTCLFMGVVKHDQIKDPDVQQSMAYLISNIPFENDNRIPESMKQKFITAAQTLGVSVRTHL